MAGWLTAVLCVLSWGSQAILAEGMDPVSGERIRICVLPFHDTGTAEAPPSDLSPLLEARLAANPWLELVPARKVYEKRYEVGGDPALVKGIWGGGAELGEAETYSLLYERWWMKAGVRFPCDYAVVGKVIATGRRRTVTVDLLSGTRPGWVVFSSLREAPSEEGIAQAVEGLTNDLRGFLHVQWSEEHLKELRRRRFAQICPLATAVDDAEKAVEADPDAFSLRILLLAFYAEDRSTYSDRAIKLAGEIAHAWNTLDAHPKELAYQLAIDPFVLLCEGEEDKGNWSGVLEAARLGMESHPLRSAEYAKWASLAEEKLRPAGKSR